MTVVFSDSFAGSGNWDPAKWSTISSGVGSFTQVGGYGQIITPAAGSYNDKMQARTLVQVSGGEYRMSFTVDVKDTDYLISLNAAVSGEAPVNWTWLPQYGYAVRYDPQSGTVYLIRSDNYSATVLSTATVTNVVGDVVHLVMRPGTGVFVWKNAAARPTTPTIASTDGTYTSGFGGIGYQAGGAATSRTLRFDNVELDDLATGVPVTDFYAATSGGLVPLTLSFA